MNLYEKIISDKGSNKADTVNNPLKDYLLDESEVKEFISTNSVSLNLLFSGRVNGGIPQNSISMISAPSRFGKSIISMAAMFNAQKKGMTVVVIDTEFAFSYPTAKAFGIDCSKEKLIVLQEASLESVRNIIAKIFQDLTSEERKNIFVVVDSWGALVTVKSQENAELGKTTLDMTESKLKNNLAGILSNSKATVFVINHVMDNLGGFGEKLLIPGGKRLYFLSGSIILVSSRSKEKDSGDEVSSYILGARSHKSRFSVESSELEFRIKKNGGLDIFYGILPDALEGKFVIAGDKKGSYKRAHIENDESVKEDNIYTSKFWLPIFKDTNFKEYLETKYQYSNVLDIKTEDVGDLFDDNVEVEKPVKKKKEKAEK
jgi:recombination protein RecA